MKKYLLLALFSLLALGLFGCSSKSGTGPNGEDLSAGANGDLYGLSEEEIAARQNARYGSGNIPLAEGSGIFRDVNFGFDSYQVSDSARQNIEYNAQILRDNPRVQVQLEGHCDERGTAEYNLALGQRRAQAVADVLLSYGIAKQQLELISYGSEVPLDPRSNEEAWAKNRRVHFSAFRNLPN